MTNTIPAPDPGTPDLCPYDALGTHLTRYAAKDVERLKESLTAARSALPAMSRAFRENDVEGFCSALADADLDLIRALAKAEALLADLRS